MQFSGTLLVLMVAVSVRQCRTYFLPFFPDSAIVATKYGVVNGSIEYSCDGTKYYSYKGIPYAKPPVGVEGRFKAPEPPDYWMGVKNVQKHGASCMQKNILFEKNAPVIGSEDCLYLNVYVPKISAKRMPVMIFIHYGAFRMGSGNSDILGPDYFMDKSVILVTFNYRLAVLGFLSSGDDASPGNFAFKDQVAAFAWVKENVESFGGDSNKITIFGQSAGAGSVHLHILSPLSEGLFSGAISQSGSALSLWAKPQNLIQTQVFYKHASLLGCNTNDTQTEIADCLRRVDAVKLVESMDNFTYFNIEPISLYTPVTEKKTASNPHPFLVEEPLSTILNGNFEKVPWILGVTSDEGILRAAPLLRNPKVRDTLNNNFDIFGPNMFGIGLSVPTGEINTVWSNVTETSLGQAGVDIHDPDNVQKFIDLYSDRAFVYGSYQSALLHAYKNHSPVWFYNFAYRGRHSYGDLFALTHENFKFPWGVSHCDDLLYLFYSPKFFKPLTGTDKMMSKIMTELWANFAKYRNPTPIGTVKKNAWEPLRDLSEENVLHNSFLTYLNISGPYSDKYPIRMEINNRFYPDRMKYWTSLPLGENANVNLDF